MSKKPPADSLLALAAQARAEGGSWEAVGKQVRRAARTVRKWPLLYPERWAQAMRVASRQVIDDAASESVLVLRQLVRSPSEKIRQTAAWRLIFQRLELCKIELHAAMAAALATPHPPSDAQLVAAFVEAHPREQLIRLAANLLNARVPQCLAVPRDEATGGN
jgi:hypothetical protein